HPDLPVSLPVRRPERTGAEGAGRPQAPDLTQAAVELLVGLIELDLAALQLGRAIHRLPVTQGHGEEGPGSDPKPARTGEEGGEGAAGSCAHRVRQDTVPEIRS